ncbi:hypothetical protein [Flavobacterium sp. HJSW_4]|uniref:hypothetical protein n=1 Tax=Flavobacterium sp. HJSW_4 TaxID=3344660 RepID=UPI0036D37026
MRKTIYFLLLIVFFSCNEKKKDNEIKPDNKEFNDQGIQEIGHLYNPETLTTRPIKLYINSDEKNYEIDIFNSDLLKEEKENLKFHSDKIALLLRKHLSKNKVDYNDIIVRIYLKKEGKQSFQYSKQELIEIGNKNL